MDKNQDKSTLPMKAMKDIPTPKIDAKRIIEFIKEDGWVKGYKLSYGTVLNKKEGVIFTKQVKIERVGLGETKVKNT